jgi:hypothetical protein
MQNHDPEKEIRGAEPEAQAPNKNPTAGRRSLGLSAGDTPSARSVPGSLGIVNPHHNGDTRSISIGTTNHT